MRYKVPVFFLSLIFVAGAIVLGMHLTTIKTINVTGNIHNTREEILDLIGIHDGDSVLYALTHRVELVEDIKYILRIEVEYPNLKEVNVNVIEKDLIGYILYMGGYLCIDGNGYIVDYVDEIDSSKLIVKGIDINDFELTKPLNVSIEVIEAVDAIYRNKTAFNLDIDTLDFRSQNANDIQLSSGDIRIQIGTIDDIEEKFGLILKVLEQIPDDESGVIYIKDVDKDIIFKKD